LQILTFPVEALPVRFGAWRGAISTDPCVAEIKKPTVAVNASELSPIDTTYGRRFSISLKPQVER
jgi:hypothetical protein